MVKNSDRGGGDGLSLERRAVVKATGATIASSVLPVAVAGASGNTTVLGDFEGSLDGWKTNGGNELASRGADTWDKPITKGSQALEVRSTGDPYPLVFNSERTAAADFASNPYLLADVTVAGFEKIDDDVDFSLRFHFSRSGGQGRTRGRGNGNDPSGGGPSGQSQSPNVEIFDPIRVPQGGQMKLYWDLRALSTEKRENAKRIGIAWHAHGTEPKKGPSGRGPGEPLRGRVYFDNVRITDNLTEFNESAIEHHLLSLQRNHGSYTVSTTAFDRDNLIEEGVIEFYDGTEVATRLAILGDGKFEYTIGDTTYRLGSGWE